MKKFLSLALAALFVSASAVAQQPSNPQTPNQGTGCAHHCGNCPHHQHQASAAAQQPAVNADGIAMEIVRAFPTAKSVKKESKYTSVFDASKKLLGYAVYSKPASDGIKGYNGETPLMIAFDRSKKIISVELLANSETPRFVKTVQDAGFFKSWNGLSPKSAAKKQVDAVSGATYTSTSVAKSLQAAMKDLKL